MEKEPFKLFSENDALFKMSQMLDEEESPNRISRRKLYKFLSERAGIQLVPKLIEIMNYTFNKIDERELVRIIIRGPRGGGKTFGIATCIEFPLWFWYDFDCVNMGGSTSQAKKAYKAIQTLLQIPEVAKQVKNSIQAATEKHNGTWINVLASSTRQVRSPHPGNRNKGGLLFIDEECEIQDQSLVDAAKPLVNSANPSIIIRSSTQHKVGDSFEECWNNAKKLGYKKFESDIFDVCQTCTRDCKVSFEDDPKTGCYDAIRKDTFDRQGNVIQVGYCKGRAHHDGIIYETKPSGKMVETYVEEHDWKGKVEGWVSIAEIYQGFLDSDKETFEVEWMGKTKSKKGKIYDPYLIDEAEEKHELSVKRSSFRRCPKSIGVDWGFAGMCVVTYFFVYNKIIYLYWVDTYRNVGMDYVIGDIRNRAKQDGHEIALGDSEGAYENEELSKFLTVNSVAFGLWKDFGIGNIRNLLEKKMFRVLKHWDGHKNPGFEIWDEQMRNYRYDDNGKPLKKNDHCPDSTLCGLLKWAPKRHKKRSGDILNEPRIHMV